MATKKMKARKTSRPLDRAHKAADKELTRIEGRLDAEYSRAAKELEQKALHYFKRFEELDARKIELLNAGKITEKEYLAWRKGKMIVGERWNTARDAMARDLVSTNRIAAGIINSSLPKVYAINANYGMYEAEMLGAKLGTSFTLYSTDAVERLLQKNPRIIPKVKPDIPRDLRWNRQKITSEIMQGILQGESIPQIARRLRDVTDMNRAASIRNARTYVTAAENGGRADSYRRARDEYDIDLEQMWIATLDGRTRQSHRMLDGQVRPVGEEFSNGCEYPGDPDGPAEEIYNCRCSIVAVLKGIGLDTSRREIRGYESYEEWERGKKV